MIHTVRGVGYIIKPTSRARPHPEGPVSAGSSGACPAPPPPSRSATA